MKVGVMLPIGDMDGPGGTSPTWRDISAIARTTEESGLDSAWLADHLFYRDDEGKEYGIHEAWTVLSAVAAVTSRIELGTLVVCASFRDPGVTAKMATALDTLSSGRLVLGVGSGWHDAEYDAFGIPKDHRVGRFEEWLEILARLLRRERVTFEGRYHRVDGAILLPPPQRQIPILIAAKRPRMLDLTARWADAWNTAWFGHPNDRLAERMAAFDEATARAEPRRDVERTVGITVRDPEQDVADPSEEAFGGDVDDLTRGLEAYANMGVEHVMAGLEPISVRSVERLAEATRRLRA